MFNEEVKAALKDTLDAKHVKSRSQAGRSLSYIEGWWAIAEANRIFGFDGWDRELIKLEQCGEPRLIDGKHRVAYIATVRIRVWTGNQTIVRDGTGYGSGIDKDLGGAFESAVKEAETDAMKRAFMTFGNPFGLALYDKEQTMVEVKPEVIADDHPMMVWAGEVMTEARKCKTAGHLTALWEKETDNYKACAAFDKGLSQEVRTLFQQVKQQLSQEAA